MDETTVINKKTYLCNGSCGAHITQEQYDGGLTACGTEGCTMKDQAFTEESADEHGAHVVVKTSDEADVIINN